MRQEYPGEEAGGEGEEGAAEDAAGGREDGERSAAAAEEDEGQGHAGGAAEGEGEGNRGGPRSLHPGGHPPGAARISNAMACARDGGDGDGPRRVLGRESSGCD